MDLRAPLCRALMRKDSARSSRCCARARTLYPSRRIAAYRRPLFMREQKAQMDTLPPLPPLPPPLMQSWAMSMIGAAS